MPSNGLRRRVHSVGGFAPPRVPEEDLRRRDPAAGKVPDLGGEIEVAVFPLDADPGHGQPGPELPGTLLVVRAVRTAELVRAGGGPEDEPGLLLLEQGEVVRRLGARREGAEHRVAVGLADVR